MTDPMHPVAATDGGGQDAFIFLAGVAQHIADTNATAQKQVAEHQAKTEAQRVNLEHARLQADAAFRSKAMQYGFTVTLLLLGMFGGVIAAGFATGNMGVVTHALTLAAGGLAGFGLGRQKR